MIRNLLATTAIVAVLAVPALAQTSSSSSSSSVPPSSSSSSSSSSVPPPPAPSAQPSGPASTLPAPATPPASSPPPAGAPTTTTTTPRTPITITSGYTRVDSDRLATRIIGMPVYDSTAADANNLGDINDIVVSEDGAIAAIVLGVGGFLGLGEKQVAVDYSALEWVVAVDNTERFVLQTTVDELTQAPDFTVVEDDPADGASVAP